MKFVETELPGAYVIELERIEDDRGFFARAWCQREFEKHGLNAKLVQCNLSYNHARGTLRGMHYQVDPYREVKLVRCIKGSIFDVIVDIRPESPSYRRWLGVELTDANRRTLYVPEGFAHGYLTLSSGAEVLYQVSEFYTPGSERGVGWDDPAFGIEWPIPVTVISDRDKQHPRFEV